MIFTERTITVVNDSATINKPLILYRGDKNIELKITIAESQFKFRNTDASNVIETTDASYAQLVINTPYNSPIFSDVAATKNGAVIFVITEAMIDEIREVGAYEIQIRLLDDNKQSRASIPPVSNAIEIREPIAIEDGSAVDSNAVNVAKVNRALTTTSAPLEAFDSQGNYIKKTWGDGDPITDAALNKMEAGIDGVNKKVANNSSQIKDIVNQSGNISNYNILPRIYLIGDTFNDMTSNKNEVDMKMAFKDGKNSFDAFIKIKWQGSSSIHYPKKNFTIKMYKDDAYTTKLKKELNSWGINENKYVLKANWIDRTHARNVVSARIWSDIVKTRKNIPTFMQNCPNSGAIDGFPVRLFVNGEYQGLYTFNLAKDDYLFNFTDDTNSFIVCATGNTGHFYNTNGWILEYPDLAPSSWDTLLNNFVNLINNSTDEEFKSNFNQYADLESFIDYYIFAYLNCGLDSLGQNMIMTSDIGDKLYASAYDLDSTWGLFWNGTKIVDYNYPCPDSYQESNSALWQRFEPIFKDEIYNRYIELTSFGMPLNPVNLIEKFEEFSEIMTDDLIKEDKEIYSDLPFVGSYKQIRTFINERKKYVDECMVKIKNGTMHEVSQIESISINESIAQLPQGSTAQLTVSVTPSDITDYTVLWLSNNEEAATVSTSGLVTAIRVGDVTITAKIGEISTTITLSVIENKSALTIQLNANTAYLFGTDNEIVTGNVTTALPIKTGELGYALATAGADYSAIISCEGKKYVSGNIVKTTDEECIGAGWGLLWIRILNATLNGDNIKDWAVNNNLEFTYNLISANMQWLDYTLPTDRTWKVENLGDSYYKCYTKYCTAGETPTDIQFEFPSTWYNNNISHSQTDYYGNITMGLFKQTWSGNINLVLTIKKTDLTSNTSDALNEYLTNNPIILKYPDTV